jgi:hypothetical protein
MEWDPQPHVAQIIEQVREIQAEYSQYGAMTLRQIFYRLVGQYDYEKTDRAYKRLGDYLVKARRAQLIGWSTIRDDELKRGGGGGYQSTTSWWDAIESSAEYFELNHMIDQPVVIEIWCEAKGMLPMLSRMTSDYHIPVFSPGGFSSVTVTHDAAQRVIRRSVPTVMLHVGDYDPSGESIFNAIAQDVGKFVAEYVGARYNPETGETITITGSDDKDCRFLPRRVALTQDQVVEFELPTAPKKTSDSRSNNWYDDTTQLEAMPPDLLEQVVVNAVKTEIDHDVLDALLDREALIRQELIESVRDARN